MLCSFAASKRRKSRPQRNQRNSSKLRTTYVEIKAGNTHILRIGVLPFAPNLSVRGVQDKEKKKGNRVCKRVASYRFFLLSVHGLLEFSCKLFFERIFAAVSDFRLSRSAFNRRRPTNDSVLTSQRGDRREIHATTYFQIRLEAEAFVGGLADRETSLLRSLRSFLLPSRSCGTISPHHAVGQRVDFRQRYTPMCVCLCARVCVPVLLKTNKREISGSGQYRLVCYT